MSPPGGGDPEEEDWPIIQPTQTCEKNAGRSQQALIKPSLGDSVIEGMQNLNLNEIHEEYDGNDNSHTAKVTFNCDDESKGKVKPTNCLTPTLIGTGRPLSSSQLPKPRDSMLASLSRRVESPAIRQTKTSALRLKNSIGKRTWNPILESKQDEGGQSGTHREIPRPAAVITLKDEHTVGPVRTNSRGRYGVTAKGSPYTITPRSASRKSKDSEDENRGLNLNEALVNNAQVAIGSTSMEKKGSYTADQVQRKSSIPLPTWPPRQSPESNDLGRNNSLIHQNSPGTLEADKCDPKKYSPDSFPEVPEFVAELQGSDTPAQATLIHELSAVTSNEQLTAREMLSTPVPKGEEESMIDSDSFEGSVRGYDAHGGFRVKRVRNTPKGGPTLRITDSASRILLTEEDTPAGVDGSNINLRRRETHQDLRETAGLKNQIRRTSGLFQRPLSFARSITERSFTVGKTEDNDEMQKLIKEIDADRQKIILGTDDGRHSSEPHLSPASTQHLSIEDSSSKRLPPDEEERTREACGSSDSHSTPTIAQGDWPCKDFTDFKARLNSNPTSLKESSPKAADLAPIKRVRSRASDVSRPATIIVRAEPDKKTAPFLFQDLEKEQLSQEQFLIDTLPHVKITDSDASTPPATGYPPRTSSRKPKPPPIFVSPTKGVRTGNRFPEQALKAQGLNLDILRKPKNVKTFSQSISPGPDTGKPKVPSEWHPSPSSSKKVLTHMRGLFNKRSTESQLGGDPTTGLRKVPSLLRVRNSHSVRRKPVPHTARFPNSLLDPSSALHEHPRNDDNAKRPIIRNPFASPITPFTAGIKASPITTDSPSLHVLKSSPPTIQTPTTPVSLHSATRLTHSLLNLARTEPTLDRKERLIELSRCMVEVVSMARDAEKAMEQARIEAAKAEMNWLKIQKEISNVEGCVRNMLLMLPK